ncbi:hypothetical protein BC830DRAFT_902911 [Chytriomyces sp. MP71]|nr:hypothetical protein BC830DRAFT_902911 [Chytriomyces sp. MP71]
METVDRTTWTYLAPADGETEDVDEYIDAHSLRCMICTEGFSDPVQVAECGHRFCRSCLHAWFHSQGQVERSPSGVCVSNRCSSGLDPEREDVSDGPGPNRVALVAATCAERRHASLVVAARRVSRVRLCRRPRRPPSSLSATEMPLCSKRMRLCWPGCNRGFSPCEGMSEQGLVLPRLFYQDRVGGSRNHFHKRRHFRPQQENLHLPVSAPRLGTVPILRHDSNRPRTRPFPPHTARTHASARCGPAHARLQCHARRQRNSRLRMPLLYRALRAGNRPLSARHWSPRHAFRDSE